MMWPIFLGIALAVAMVAAALLLGPRVAADTAVTFDPAAIGADPQAYIEAKEAETTGLRDNAAKEIVWADPDARRRTPYSIIYIHGFSATKQEVRPLPDLVAQELGANIFFTRLAGHGLDGEALADARLNDWIDDFAEAMAIGRAIGERVIVMATSTGASLASWAATRPELARDMASLVLISPNYGVRARGSWLLTMPWGRQMAELIIGPEYRFAIINDGHEANWTTRFPTRAILPMAAAAALAYRSPVENVDIPALFVFSEADAVVRPERTHAMARRWGAETRTILVEESGDPGHHLIAGEIVSPDTTRALADQIVNWLRMRAG